MSAAPCGVQPPPPTIASGRSAAASSSRMRARSAAARRGCRARHGRRVGRVGHLRQHVLGQRQHDRARAGPPTAVANARATSSGMRSGRSISNTHLAMRAEHLLVVDLLERLAPAMPARHLADQQHERRGVLHRGVHAGRGVRRARAARDHADAGPAGQLAVGIGGVGGRRLVAAGDHAQPVAVRVEAVEQREVALARHAERELDAVQRELVGEQLPAALSQLDRLVQEDRVALRLRTLAVLVAHVADGRRALRARAAAPCSARTRSARPHAWRRRPDRARVSNHGSPGRVLVRRALRLDADRPEQQHADARALVRVQERLAPGREVDAVAAQEVLAGRQRRARAPSARPGPARRPARS